ncbi:hypothetical protein BDY19DRAFT_996268 [Irpex rosettiformis]|uniref:Uncharacterized protein n=1 Tax=Irpex rosettiformis TaxID=378272 RepID=A0ACB8TVS3_9APHY|nr:hypothetical protein BDY19DRAFT_996268 [Irpex rosettiformis]
MNIGDLPTTPQKAPNASSTPSDTLKSLHLPVGNTPVSKKKSPQVSSANYSVEASRYAVAHDLPDKVPEVDFAFFQDYILPPLNDKIKIQDVISTLETKKVIVDGRWAAFPSDPWEYASGSGGKENTVFSYLADVIKEIISHSGIGDGKAIDYVSRPNSNLVCCCEEEKKAARPDGYFLFEDHTERFDARDYWRDILTPAEFKLRDRHEDLQDDVNKICWNMYQVMKEDPRRRFVFGFTIENTQMRVWLMSRAEVIVSQPFNFITDHAKFIHFVLSQVYAKPHELGIDTNMTVVKGKGDDSTLVYDIVLHHDPVEGGREEADPIVVRTVYLINDDGVKYPLGRGTRVWRVDRLVHGRVDESAPGRVLKEGWVDEDREREGNILEQIKNQPGVIADDDLKLAFDGLLLTPVASGDVMIGDHPDSTRGLITRGADIPDTAEMFSLKVPDSHQPSHTARGTDSAAETQISIAPCTVRLRQKLIRNLKKRHYRILLAEECKPLSKETSLHNVFLGLAEITDGLSLLHLSGCGWVHRDVSTGNIMYHRESDKWKLSDVEFAKRLDFELAHEIRTGTANFMAVEVDKGRYLYRTTPDVPEVPDRKRGDVKVIAKRMNQRRCGNSPAPRKDKEDPSTFIESTPKQPFHYNPTHDLESLWWIGVYFVINKITLPAIASDGAPAVDSTDTILSPATSSLTVEQRQYARRLFYSYEARSSAMSTEDTSDFDEEIMHWPAHLKEICLKLIELRKRLRKHYAIIERPGFVITNQVCNGTTSLDSLYDTFRMTFTFLAGTLAARDITVAPLPFDFDEEGVLHAAAQKSARASVKSNSKRKSHAEGHSVASSSASKKQKPNTQAQPSVGASMSMEVGDMEDRSGTGKGKGVAR